MHPEYGRIISPTRLYLPKNPRENFNNPSLPDLQSFRESCASSRTLGLFSIRLAACAAYYISLINEGDAKETAHLTSRILCHANDSITKGAWAGQGWSVANPFMLKQIVINFQFESATKKLFFSSSNHEVLYALMHAIITGTRKKYDYNNTCSDHDNDVFFSEIDNGISIDTNGLYAEDYAYLTFCYFVSAVNPLLAHNDDGLYKKCIELSVEIVSGKYVDIETSGDFGNWPELYEDGWYHPAFAAIRQRMLGRHAWVELLKRDAQIFNINVSQLNQNIQQIGPSYNKLDSTGTPMPGVLCRPQGVTLENETPAGTVTSINFHDEYFAVNTSQDETKLPLIFYDDIATVMALVFGDEEGPVSPRFNLESLQRKYGFSHDTLIQRKDFFPSWLGRTRFGQSLYYADYLLQQIIGFYGFNVQSIRNIGTGFYNTWLARFDSNPSEAIERWINKNGGNIISPDLGIFNKLSDFKDPESSEIDHNVIGGRYCIKLSDINIRIDEKEKEIILISGNCYIEHANKIKREEEIVDVIDNAYLPARIFSEHYKTIGRLFPVFLRVEQLLLLYKMMEYGRSMGWTPKKKEIKDIRRSIDALGHPSSVERYVPYPFHYFGCTCTGNWAQVLEVPLPGAIEDSSGISRLEIAEYPPNFPSI